MRHLFLLLLCIVSASVLAQTPVIKRSSTTVAHFMKAHPCPDGPEKGRTDHCEGFVVNHKWPLCARGLDVVENMRWQTVAAAKLRDADEKRICATLRKWWQEQ